MVLIGAVGLLIASGCNDGRPERVQVSGKVLIDGKPLTVGDVRFVPEGARPSSGKLDEQGRFTLTCYDGNDGAVPGLHRIQVSSSEITQNGARWYAPIKYANFRTADMSFEVTGPTRSLVIELTSDGGPAKVYISDDTT